MSSKTENAVVELIRSRGKFGLDKYGTTMDRTDLTPVEWCQHLQEELADGLQYAERVKEGLKLLEEAAHLINSLAMVAEIYTVKEWWEEPREWLSRYKEQFRNSDET